MLFSVLSKLDSLLCEKLIFSHFHGHKTCRLHFFFGQRNSSNRKGFIAFKVATQFPCRTLQCFSLHTVSFASTYLIFGKVQATRLQLPGRRLCFAMNYGKHMPHCSCFCLPHTHRVHGLRQDTLIIANSTFRFKRLFCGCRSRRSVNVLYNVEGVILCSNIPHHPPPTLRHNCVDGHN